VISRSAALFPAALPGLRNICVLYISTKIKGDKGIFFIIKLAISYKFLYPEKR